MKTLIVYATTHGCTEKCAQKVRDGLSGDIDMVNLKQNARVDPAAYDTVIIGGSIHAGRIQGRVKKFYTANQEVLLTKKLGLFICHMEEDNAQKELDDNYPEALRNHATAKGLFGGTFDFEKMNFVAKAIVKKVGNVTESVNNVNESAIKQFITDIK